MRAEKNRNISNIFAHVFAWGGGKMYEFSYNGYAGKITYAFGV